MCSFAAPYEGYASHHSPMFYRLESWKCLRSSSPVEAELLHDSHRLWGAETVSSNLTSHVKFTEIARAGKEAAAYDSTRSSIDLRLSYCILRALHRLQSSWLYRPMKDVWIQASIDSVRIGATVVQLGIPNRSGMTPAKREPAIR